jgi:Cft2 family RNA processing exonuclease
MRFKPNTVDAAFPLSNHADFNQLLNYVKQVKPKSVYTIHGFKDDFGNYVQKKLGIRAHPIVPLSQKHIMEYF